MTNDEKAKAYEMALEAARKDLGVDRKEWNVIEHVLRNIFPQLRESEDERIRKWLLECVENLSDGNFIEVSKQDVIFYLEKQKVHFRDDTKMIGLQDYFGLNDLERAIHRGFLSAGVENVPVTIIKETAQECLAQMKPVEWSEDIIRKAIKEVGLTQHQIDWFKTNVFPPKQEWSEEDELMRTAVIQTLERFGGRGTTGMQIDWLKSLRPQPQWKPSEEQISSLKQARDYYMSGRIKYVGRHLSEIAEQLEKLM